MELSENPLYDPDANKPWWELAWNAVVRWFASILQAYNDLDIGWKIGIGLVLFALACIITALSAGQASAALAAIGQMMITFLVGIATGVAMSAVIALISGESLPDALLSGLADAIFWGGVFAFVSASVNAVKAGIRAVKNAKLAGSTQTGAQPCNTVNQCFKEGTLVETEEGLKPIEEIEVGDKVLAYDEETGEQAYKEVPKQ